ncbi:MAG: preprotein translocase subunit TatB [Deltaproteobacteria bacterium]|nr:preprotein translocase subunit TatB [Deltaproteobacteria bacterium]
MHMKKVDARGLSCPEPVVRARQAVGRLAAGDQLEILIETEVARENVLRCVRSMGCEAEVSEVEDGFRLLVKKQ